MSELAVLEETLKNELPQVCIGLQCIEAPAQHCNPAKPSKELLAFVQVLNQQKARWDPHNTDVPVEYDQYDIDVIWELEGETFMLREKYTEYANGRKVTPQTPPAETVSMMTIYRERPDRVAAHFLSEYFGQSMPLFKEMVEPDGKVRFSVEHIGSETQTTDSFMGINNLRADFSIRKFVCKITDGLRQDQYFYLHQDGTITYYRWVKQ